ncbi:MAG TPA: alpha/beta fold hydrolase [Xylella sp.]
MSYPDYPFIPKCFEVRPRITMRYLDEGPRNGAVIVMLHGNPSWSYYWRHLVSALRDGYRCIVPDHVGMGLSDKPGDAPGVLPRYDYTLQSRVDDLEALLRHAGIGDATPLTLAVHDWGGMIGFGWALTHAAQVRRLVIMNTAVFPIPVAKRIPWQIALGRHWKIGEWVIRGFNAFAVGASWMGVETPLPRAVRRAYVAPYHSWAHRRSIIRFIQDIPLEAGDRAWPLLDAVGKALSGFADRPAFIGWGLKDIVFDHRFLDRFRVALPHAQLHVFEDAGHYVLEDKSRFLVTAIRVFLDTHP